MQTRKVRNHDVGKHSESSQETTGLKLKDWRTHSARLKSCPYDASHLAGHVASIGLGCIQRRITTPLIVIGVSGRFAALRGTRAMS